MSQNDYVIANQTTPLFRADLNLALQALASTSSGATAPSPTYANMMWYDTASNTLKMRSEADDAWITLGTLDQSLNTFSPAGVATLDQTTWDAGTSTTEALISPLKLAGAIDALVVIPPQTAPSTAEVLGATAGASVGAVGSYAFLVYTTTGPYAPGSTLAGSALRYVGIAGNVSAFGGVPSGSWRCMGYGYTFESERYATLWLRIS